MKHNLFFSPDLDGSGNGSTSNETTNQSDNHSSNNSFSGSDPSTDSSSSSFNSDDNTSNTSSDSSGTSGDTNTNQTANSSDSSAGSTAPVNIHYDVFLVAQPDDCTCWAASSAMTLTYWRDVGASSAGSSYTVQQIKDMVANAGRNTTSVAA